MIKYFLPGVLVFIGAFVLLAVLFPIESEESTPFQVRLSESTIEKGTLNLINEIRAEQEIMPMTWDQDLHNIAELHNMWMSVNNIFDHNNVNQRALDYGYICEIPINATHYAGVAENIETHEKLMTDSDEQTIILIVDGWMNSPEHKRIMLSEDYENVGIDVLITDIDVYATMDLC